MKKLLLSILFLLCLIINSYAKEKIEPSFDCKKASTKVEKMICSSSELAKEDKELNELYNKYLKELQTSKYSNIRDSIIKGQRNWLKGRNKFTTEDKLSIYYTALIHAYKQVFGDPGYVKAAADTSEEDPMIVPFSFYLTNNYIIDTNKERVHIFLNQDEICSNLSKRKPITYEYYLKNGKPSKVGYESHSSIDTINLLFYKNGAYALDEDLFIYSYQKKNNNGMYIYSSPYKEVDKKYEIWRSAHYQLPNTDGHRTDQREYELHIPTEYNGNFYTQVIAATTFIENAVDAESEPIKFLYQKGASYVRIDSPYTLIYKGDINEANLVCAYVENINDMDKFLNNYFVDYSKYKAEELYKFWSTR